MAVVVSELLFADFRTRAWVRIRSFFVPSVSVVAIIDLADLAASGTAVLQLYEWERDRLFTLSKGLAGTAVSVLATLIIDAIEGKGMTGSSQATFLAAGLVVLLLAWAGFILSGLRRLADEYPMALLLLNSSAPS